ncbi:sensor histidine kinase [Streptomyces sp. CB01881]|uniref:sensor histidine kinase n=1 Tax=Streptomyces sp. CB01881 TaxID=2078691 RepID=UPI000CDC216F|nr:sensor histidine kinase [Streptomyces sp. CB01881]AUY51855.1 sensor histidine kinase [Streptomyces sp. CB01881]TYC71283.1 sensor histidine kinase [Streptomyces sp. CB01881]
MPSTPLRRALARSAERPPWSAAAWRDVRFIAAGIPLAMPIWLACLTPKAFLPVTALTLLCLRLLTAAQRGRLRALRGVEVPALLRSADTPAGLLTRLRTGVSWRQAGYHLLVGPLLALGSLCLLYAWGAGLLLTTVLGWAWLMPSSSPVREHPLQLDVPVTLCGAVLLAVLPWAVAWLARLEETAARRMLGPGRAETLERRVEEIAESRAGLVDAVDAERRRIERDLHDGAQQRLTSLAMNLGLARRALKDVPPEVMQVIVDAHEEAQAAIDELRDLVRGLHPAVLEDRGLDAALSGIAARAPLPVRLDVDLTERIAPTVEAVAYFTVSEALTNVAKHARASRVQLSVRTAGGRLLLVVSDDGVGGADASRGTGLTGLRKRAASVDGTLSVLSPLGGPTTITVELPCAL